jgi:hypothetical protein
MSKLFRAASVLVLGAAALGFSATKADAGNGRGHGRGHHHGHGCGHAYVARPVYYAPRPVYVAPRPVYIAPRPVYVAPYPYLPAPPVVYAPVPVYDHHRDGVAGFIGISGPHVSIGIGF